MLAFLRIKEGYSFGLIGQAARSIWGLDWIEKNSRRKGGDQIHGQGLIMEMEDVLGMERCESDDMILAECHCHECRRTDFYITPRADISRECAWCGSERVFLICPEELPQGPEDKELE